ncbi:MAG: pilus assembly protein PilM [Bacilli bacterium]|nr:pilus assembly protein PilM [Bacilli bacterium]
MRKIMAALDIGNSNVKLVVAEMTKGKFNVLSVSETKTLGIKKNVIVSEADLIEAVQSVIKDSETKLNMPIRKVLVVVPSQDIEFTIGEAKINIDDGTVNGSDISRVILESYNGIIPDNMELVNVLPMHFKLDNNEVVNNPNTLVSSTLAVKSVIMMAPKSDVYKYLSVLDKLNIDIVDIGTDALGDYYVFKNEKIDKQVGVIINLGGSKTTVSIFNKGIITNSSVIELGSKNIDNDIAYIYRVNLDDANKLKENFAYAHPKYTSSSDEIVINDKDNNEVKINQQEISKIAYFRIKEILENVKKEINHLTKKEISYIIVTGGTSESIDFKLIIDELFDKNATIGKIKTLGVRHNKFSSVIGLIKWYNSIQQLKMKDYSIFSIEEQEEFSGVHNEGLSDDSVIGKFFNYFLDN